jgi:hypothetical protein
MRELNLAIEPLPAGAVLACEIRRSVGEHGRARISVRLSETDIGACESLVASREPVVIQALGGARGKETVFRGLPVKARAKWVNGVATLDMELMTGSRLLDIHPHTRVFQSAETTYEGVLGHIGAGYADFGCIMTVGEGVAIEGLLVQREETDWAFARRLASHFHSVVVADDLAEGTNIFFGPPYRDRRESVSEADASRLVARVDDDGGALCYEVESRDIHGLGERLRFRGGEYMVYAIESRYDGGHLTHRYDLRRAAGFLTERRGNEALRGLSLPAKITGARGALVSLAVECELDPDPGSRWYDYDTVYSSPDGTGWYFMPEIGDGARLSFPDGDEGRCHVTAAVHTEARGRREPDHKSLRTKWGKEVTLTPHTIALTNNKGMTVVLDDNKGILLQSDKDIHLAAEGGLSVASQGGEVRIAATRDVTVIQGATAAQLGDSLSLSGGRVSAGI